MAFLQQYVFRFNVLVERRRTLRNLLLLREGLSDRVRPRLSEQNLLVASWNIKEFGHTTQRLPEAFFYMAEIISRFDLVAVQEIKSNLADLHILMRLLGDDWAYLVNDITEGDAGNSERSGYLYNKKRVEFGGLAGEIVLWDDLIENAAISQLKRTPYITGFKAGWKTFAMVCLHLHPGKDAEDVALRGEEVRLLLAAIDHKISQGRLWNDNLILCGDFNFYSGANRDDATIQMVNDAGFREVQGLIGRDTNASHTEAYDRLFVTSNDYFRVATDDDDQEIGDVFELFDYVYQDGQETSYAGVMRNQYTGSRDMTDPANLSAYYRHPWRKNQMSDHFPIWFELLTDSTDDFMESKLEDY